MDIDAWDSQDLCTSICLLFFIWLNLHASICLALSLSGSNLISVYIFPIYNCIYTQIFVLFLSRVIHLFILACDIMFLSSVYCTYNVKIFRYMTRKHQISYIAYACSTYNQIHIMRHKKKWANKISKPTWSHFSYIVYCYCLYLYRMWLSRRERNKLSGNSL